MDFNKIIARAKAILLTPRSEWPVIAAEPDTIGGIYTGYVIVMAAIPAIVSFVSSTLIGYSVPFLGSFRLPLGIGLTHAVVSYVVSLISLFIVALIVEALAPSFSGEKNRVQALKAVTYSHTAFWVAAIIGIIPGLRIIAVLVGIVYAIYLLNMGLPYTMKCPPDKSIGYTAVSIIVAILVSWLLAFVVFRVAGLGYGLGAGMGGYSGYTHHSLTHDGGGSFAPGSTGAALQAWSQKMAEAGKQMDAAQKSGDASAQANAVGQMLGAALGSGGKVQALAPDQIKPFVPDAISGLKRTQMSVDRSGALGMQISKATATYSDGGQHQLNLEITDTGSLKGLVGLAASGWAGVEEDKETDTGYDKTYKNNGQLVHEKWDKSASSGEYGVVVGDRFSVKVSGNASSIDDLKAAVGQVNLAGLEALKNEGVQSPN